MGIGNLTAGQKQNSPWWEYCFVVLVLFLSTDAVIPLLPKGDGRFIDPVSGSAMVQMLWMAIYSVTLLLIVWRWSKFTRIAFYGKLLWLLVALALVSIAWSEAPWVTLRRSIALLGTTAFGVYLAARYTRRDLLHMLLWVLGLSAVLSIGFVLFWPDYGIHYTYNKSFALRGIYDNKNFLGSMMSLAAIVWLVYASDKPGTRIWGFCFCLGSLILMVLSKSVTALIVFLVLGMVIVVFQVMRLCCRKNKKLPLLFLVALVGGGSLGLLFVDVGAVLTLLGRDETLTGRTELWQAAWEMIRQRPWGGYGYGAFWLNWQGPSADLWRALDWYPMHAHNGYLDVWLQLGLVGMVVLALSLVGNLYKALVMAWRDGQGASLLPLFYFLLLSFIMIHNVAESSMLLRNHLFWIIYVVISVQLGRDYCNRPNHINSKLNNSLAGPTQL